MTKLRRFQVTGFVLFLAGCAALRAAGPLCVSRDNPRYFADADGNVVYLTGSHTWNVIVDMGPSEPPEAFDYGKFLDWVAGYGHNFIRLWTWDLTLWNTAGNAARHRREPKMLHVAPLPWARTESGKFDLEQYSEEYFRRLRERAEQAGQRGFYVSVMLFEGWGVQRVPDGWRHHPMNPANNVNGVDGGGVKVHELGNARVTALQEAYVRKVVDTVNDLDYVLYEISNENHPASTEWQYHMIRFIHDYEKGKPKQHPVGMTFQFQGGTNADLFASPAEWISPNSEGGYRDDPPAADGGKVILSDTDHLWGVGGNRDWVWKSFTRGLNPIFMDPYDGAVLGEEFDPRWEPVRKAMGHTLRYARRMDLKRTVPRGDLASSGYCLAAEGSQYLAYLPGGGTVSVDLTAAGGRVRVEWFDAGSGETVRQDPVKGGGRRLFTAPFGGAAALFLLAE